MNSRTASPAFVILSVPAITVFLVAAAYVFPDKLAYVAAVPLGFFLILLTWHNPRIIALAVVAMIPMGTFAEISQTMSRLTLFKVLFPLPFTVLVIGMALGRFGHPRIHFLDKWIFCWVAINIFLIASSLDKGDAMSFCRRFASLSLLYFMVTRFFCEEGRYRTLTQTLIISTLVSAFIGFAIYLTGSHTFFSRENLRMTGASGIGPGGYTASLFLPIWLSLSLAMTARGTTGKILYYAIALVIASVIPLTLSRSGALVFGITVFFGLVIWRKKLTVVHCGVIVAMIMISMIFVPQSFWERASRLTEMTDTNISDYSLWRRMNYLEVGWNVISDYPFLGAGPGNFPNLHADARYQKEISLVGTKRLPHNMYMQVISETGMLGGIFFAGVMISALITTLGGLGQAEHHDATARGLLLTLTGLLLMGLFSHMLLTKYFWLTLAFVRIRGGDMAIPEHHIKPL
ncbi:MAG: hypothetical protein B6245_01075 [Desulfobacteraceae bacterium 4572_88]|nr:MAG: hypothetical protein B6245_01075 [Desulfobacteraceae bacterium 4572_88]